MKIAAIAAALACLVSSVAADHPTTMDFGMMTSNQAMTPGLRGTSVVVPAGVITNSIDAKNNKVVVSKSNIRLTKSDRVQIADVIKEMLATHPEANRAAAELVLEQLEPDTSGTTGAVVSNPAVISNVVSSIYSAMTRNPAAATGHAIGAIAAAYPAVMAPTPLPTRYDVNNPTRYIPPMSGTMGTSPYNTAGIGGLPSNMGAPASPSS
ncbi:hypothetical protein PHYSODRAFT_502154 [Phytophthora sojae]|uniref:RxLR effector protein n=1 Tax=Phytophthora sojae (strain P6497) TaxID=1094619 RepID=G4ZHF3_PHYSP|nr:hypothetical protein PHYSODRAFT_502154 [Phytophthora sojae]EGZ17623.1 hypothetical protein PHYSODRAFT_502154 [Phytophthora sojae]|eukprot:XP_009526681.1 hypothetical protein PHYSODRAFT_502154 [Phytophthora sojae]